MKKRRKIGIDFDDVLFAFNQSYTEHHNRMYGTDMSFDQITNFDMEKVWNIPMTEILPRIETFYNSEDHEKTNVLAGAAEAIQKLKETYDLYVVTSRPDRMRDATVNWLSQNIPYLQNRVHFTNQFAMNEGEGNARNKSEVCKNLGIELFIDDAVMHARDISGAGIKVLLYDTPWNRKYKNDDITRVHSWDEIVDTIEKTLPTIDE